MGDWLTQGLHTRFESKFKMKYLLINCYMPVTVLDIGERISQHDLTLVLMRLAV